ncbi:MAG TPA: hypothetical protein VFP84_34555 [Kofleriaceae bacterium]|nr:hypothetical protein [Kofleriaceae bacterium]
MEGVAASRPAFAMMDPTGDGSGIDLQLPFSFATHDGDGALVRPRLAAQYVLDNGLGAYGVLHGAGSLGAETGGNATSGIGNFELGALYHTALAPALDLGLRAGFAFATANGDDLRRLTNLSATTLARPADFATVAPGNWLRLGVSPTYHQGIGFARVDLGVDVPLTSRDQLGGDTLAHVNAGVGVALDHLTVTGELQTLIQVSGDQAMDTLYTAGVSARYQLDHVAPYLAVSMPLGNDVTGDFLAVTGGVAMAL